MADAVLTEEREGGVLLVTLNRPERHNALNRRGYEEFEAAHGGNRP